MNLGFWKFFLSWTPQDQQPEPEQKQEQKVDYSKYFGNDSLVRVKDSF